MPLWVHPTIDFLHHPTFCWTNNSQWKREEPSPLQVSHQTRGPLRCRSVSIWINVCRCHRIVLSIYTPSAFDRRWKTISALKSSRTADATQFVCLFVIAECHLALVPLPHNFITSFSRIKVSLTIKRRIKLWARIDRKCGDRRIVCLNDSSPTLRKNRTGWYRVGWLVGCLAVVMWRVLFLR